MKPLSTYIEYLLMTRHYVFVPGLGGFMFQAEEARIMLGGRLMPPLRLLKYNRFMDHDDGMLANVIMRAEGLNYDDANQRIRLSVSTLLKQVQEEGRCALGRLGYVFFDEDCHIAFRAADQVKQDAVYYGMNQLNVRSWRDVERERNHGLAQKEDEKATMPSVKHRKGVVELPTRWLRWAAIFLLVLTFCLANLIPWNNTKSEEQHYANVVDTGALLRPANAVKEVFLEEKTASTDTTTQATVETTTAINETQLVTESQVVADEAPKKTIRKNGKQYIVIVGSCKSQKEAERLVRRLAKKGYDGLKIYERDNRFRVYIETFDIKSEAVSYLNNLRETSPFGDAWLLAVRPTDPSLSLIIKNKDNDQLPMELSHLKQSAERDQG